MTTSSKRVLTREQIHDSLWNLAAQHTGKDRNEITPASRLVHDLGADSLGVVELSMELEEELGVTLPEELLDNPQVTMAEVEQSLCDKCS